MFMNDPTFFDESQRSQKKNNRDDITAGVEALRVETRRSSLTLHPNAMQDNEDLDVENLDDFGSSTGTRNSVIQQQREAQKKKIQERAKGGVVRTSLPRQFSTPRDLDVDDKPSRFGRELDDEDEDARPMSAYRASERQTSRDGDDQAKGGRTIRKQRHNENERERSRDRDRDRESRERDTIRERDRYRGSGKERQRDDSEFERDQSRGSNCTRDRERTRDREYGKEPRGRNTRSDRDHDRHDVRQRSDPDRLDRRHENSSERTAEKKHERNRRNGDNEDFDSRRPTSRHSNRRKTSRSRSKSKSPSRAVSDESESSQNDVQIKNSSEKQDSFSSKSRSAIVKAKIDITDMKSFLMRPLSTAYDIVECYIERNKSGASKMFPEYCLYLKEGDRFLLTAKKRPNNRTSNYLISMQRGDFSRKGTENYLGKLRSNFVGTEFVMYDNGVNPKDADEDTMTSNPAVIRQELGIALYAANVLGHRGPRKMKVCVPRVREDGNRVVWRPLSKEEEMINKCKEQDHTNLTYLINKAPRWNEQVCAYVLNFNGRVTMASVKNFQLVTPEDQETVVLQFGRVGKELFTMDFRAPLCPLQAFAITLSSFDSKLASNCITFVMKTLADESNVTSTSFKKKAVVLLADRVDAGMSLSFSVPASYRRKIDATAIEVPTHTSDASSLREETIADWESIDLDTYPAQKLKLNSEKESTTEADGSWEEARVAGLPDDFPVLVVNSTRFCTQARKERGEDFFDLASARLSEDDEVAFQIQSLIKNHPEEMLDSLFEQEICFHSSYGTVSSMKESLKTMHPGDRFLQLDYPAEVDGVALYCHLHTLYRISQWPSVEYLMESLRSCSRGLKWKVQIALEIKALAQREFTWFQRTQEEQSKAIDILSSLRDSLNQRIRGCTFHEDSTGNSSARSTKTDEMETLIRCLDNVENKLKDQLDQYLSEPTLTEEERRNALGLSHDQDIAAAASGLNVLDMVLFMILCRLPRAQKSSEELSKALVDHHIRILHLWKKDFGRLPPKRISLTSNEVHQHEVGVIKNIEKEIGDLTSSLHTSNDSGDYIVSQNNTTNDNQSMKYDRANTSQTASDDLGRSSIRNKRDTKDSVVKGFESIHLTSQDQRKKTKKKTPKFQPFACVSALDVLRDEKSGKWP